MTRIIQSCISLKPDVLILTLSLILLILIVVKKDFRQISVCRKAATTFTPVLVSHCERRRSFSRSRCSGWWWIQSQLSGDVTSMWVESPRLDLLHPPMLHLVTATHCRLLRHTCFYTRRVEETKKTTFGRTHFSRSLTKVAFSCFIDTVLNWIIGCHSVFFKCAQIETFFSRFSSVSLIHWRLFGV